MLEGDAAREAVASAGRRTTSRRELGRHEHFEEVSPEVGQLDAQAFDSLLEADPDEALALLADLNGATDERLRELAHRLSAQVVVDVARTGAPTRRGVGRLTSIAGAEGNLDLDRSLEAVVESRRSGARVRAEDLAARTWRRTDTAVCLLVDRSGSMAGARLAAAVVTAAAVALRPGGDSSVVAFSGDAIVLRSQGEPRAAGDVVVDLCRLRGAGVTDLGLALRVASEQLSRSRAGRRVTVLLSDCRATAGGDPLDHLGVGELVVLAPGDDAADASAFAASGGLRWAALESPSTAPQALDAVLR